MFKKAILMVAAAMLILFGASISYANQIGGMASGTGPALPAITPSVNPGGLGDALIYGYYNVRGNLNLFNIVNTSSTDGAKARVVFRNAKNSKECLDFTVCLSRGDVWTAFLMDDGTTARIFTIDTDTITAPTIPAAGQGFISGTYGPIVVTADDCREGYFEVIGLNSIPGYDKDSCTAANTVNCPITENSCRDQFAGFSVGNTMMGNNTIFELSSLATFSYNATAIADFTGGTIVITPGQEPSMAQIDGGCNVADYILMKSDIVSPYDVMSEIGGETELIITFPTRFACHSSTATSDMFNATKTSGTTRTEFCTKFALSLWDDKENSQDITQFSPSPTACFPYEVNILRIGGSSIWNSTVVTNFSTSFDLGWMDVNLSGDPTHNLTAPAASLGLPAIAYTTQTFVGAAASYMTPAAYKTNIGGLQLP